MSPAAKKSLDEKLARLPGGCGVYLMRDREARIIYIGKAKSLAGRVRSYFRGKQSNPKVSAMVGRVEDFDYIATDNEVEALLLESNLIKEHHPRYNVNLKDDKRYPYLKVTTGEPFPRIFVTRRYLSDGSRYFGPFTNAGALRTTLESLRKVFPIRGCSHRLPERKGVRECLNFHLGRCSGPCHGHISREDYRAMIDEVLMFLEGKTEFIAGRLRRQMEQASAELQFEQAARFRNQLEAVRKISQRQKIHSVGGEDYDVLAVSVDGRSACGVILKVRDGKLLGQEHHYLHNALGEPPAEVLSAFLRQNYLGHREYPGSVLLNHEVEDKKLVESILSERAGIRVRINVPVRGPKAGLVSLAGKNSHLLLEELILRRAKARQRVPEALVGLQKTLGLPSLPRLMVCFDVSTLQGDYAVAAMSAFRNGQPAKSAYRRFRIRRPAGQDDFAMLAEAVGRYFGRLAGGELEVPQLVVVDGGKGQLSAACEAVRNSGVEPPPIVSLAKREEEIFLPGHPEPYVLSRRSEALKMLQHLRDEAHRFAVSYHRT
ncbi:MAG: excinuclease ABC subunit UvrC, partial [Candidatus Glassbacteria bacterium]|nr:excinuclease ABC subunit UvrC [Candidatus Glassbacteria bacterium]